MNLSRVVRANSRSSWSLVGSASSSQTARDLSRTKMIYEWIWINTSLASICPVFGIGKVLECPYLEEVVFDLLDAPRSTIFDEVLHCVEGLVDPAPFLGAGVESFPEMSHYIGVIIPIRIVYFVWQGMNILPIIRVISKYLQLSVRNVPVFIGRAFLEYFLVLNHVVDFVLSIY